MTLWVKHNIALLWCKLTIHYNINLKLISWQNHSDNGYSVHSSNHYPCMQQSKCKEVGIAVIEIFKANSLGYGLSLQEGICPQRSSSQEHSPG